MRILVAEDQSEIRMLTVEQLEREGHYVVSVANGREALAALQRESFDIVLLDEEMPVMTGVQTLQAIRALADDCKPMVCVACTGYSSEADRVRLLDAGFDSVIAKPFQLNSLSQRLSAACSTSLTKKDKQGRAFPAANPVAMLLSRVDGDEQLAGKMIATFLREAPQRMKALEKAMKQENAQIMASQAHALKGSVSIYGLATAVGCAERLQNLGRVNDFRGAGELYKQLKEEIAKLEESLRGYAGQKGSLRQGASSKNQSRKSR
ncbi:MAG: response regulator [Candidatus Acidiferrum sp.]